MIKLPPIILNKHQFKFSIAAKSMLKCHMCCNIPIMYAIAIIYKLQPKTCALDKLFINCL